MSQLFRPRSNAIARLSLLAILGVVGGTFGVWTVFKWSDWETQMSTPLLQPVPFSHKHHVSGLGLDCRYCHSSVESSAFAGIPPTHTCMTCHSQIWQQAAMLEPVRESFASGRPLEWNRVYRLPKFVYFDHGIHVRKGVGCTTCHGNIGEMPLTWKANPFFMKDCLACHREPEKYLRPEDRVFDIHWTPPPDQLEQGAQLVRQYRIPKYRITDCYTCHR